jgi:endonuclease G
MSAESRTADLFRRSPAIREQLLGKIERNEIGGLERLGIAVVDLKAVVEGRPLAGPPPPAGLETVRQRAVEAIVRRFGRPVLLVQNGTYVAPELPAVVAELSPHRARIERAIASVGRVEFTNHAMPWGGTGWVVDERTIVTNRHVAEFVAESIGNGRFRFRMSLAGVPFGARLDMLEELGTLPPSKEIVLTSVTFIARSDQPDIALLQASSPLPAPLELANAPGADGQAIGIIGYPAYDSRNDPDDIARYFGDIFDVKRFAPGVVSQVAGGRPFFMHDATTLGGNSGSVVLDLATGKALGLHFAGTYLEGNFAVTAEQIKRAMAGQRSMVTVPDALVSNIERPDGTHQASFFEGREGYNPEFLGTGPLQVPLPALNGHDADAASPVSAVAASGKFLHYTHFSLAYSTSRRVPIVTAVNIDGESSRKIKRKDDKWFSDLRLPAEIQLTQADYGHPDIDRGHMVRREDPNWGLLSVARVANDDTFHYTNAAPQHARLNQGKTQWLGLEDYILTNSRTHGLQISVFTGPVLRGTDPFLENGVQVPEEFWKVVAAVDEETGALRSTGYLLSQGTLIGDITESFVFGEYQTYQVPVATIAEDTGLDFGSLVAADALNNEPVPEALPGRPRVVPLDRLEHMVL